MNYKELYKSKLGTLDDALSLVRSGDTIAIAGYGNEPRHFLTKLHTLAPSVTDVKIWLMKLTGDYMFTKDSGLYGHIDILTFFYDTDSRKYHDTGRFQFLPTDLHSTARGVLETRRPTIYVAAVTPMDENGNVYLSFDQETAHEYIEQADIVIFEINKNIPVVYGDTAFPIDRATCIYEADSPLPDAPAAPSSEADLKIAEHVVSLIRDGDCIQLGIGGIPNAVGKGLTGHNDLGIHTEMLTSSMGELIRNGNVTNERKNFNKGLTISTFVWGDQELYQTIANNPSVQVRRSSWVNAPEVIAQNDNMVSVNAAMQVDLTGQICSESIGTRQYSGTGGAHDFAYGAFRSKGGRGIIALQSTAKNGTISKIQAILTPGSVVTIPRTITDYIVTEYGIARMRGNTTRQRVRDLIAIAHPAFREELQYEADRLMIF